MYQKGDARIDKIGYGSDTRDEYADTRGKVCLPHSCDQWVVGGRTEVEQMIEDLQAILEQLP